MGKNKTPLNNGPDRTVFRILDVNLNRLREGLRVIEEHERFSEAPVEFSVELKKIRHCLTDIETEIGRTYLLNSRDTETDPFAGETRTEELNRNNGKDILTANFKRTQEAARVIEEYAKITEYIHSTEIAKKVRFQLYALEKKIMDRSYV